MEEGVQVVELGLRGDEGRGGEHVGDRGVPPGEHQVAQVQRADQAPRRRHDVGMHVLAEPLLGPAAEVVDHLPHAHGLGIGEVLGPHQAARAVARVRHQPTRVGRLVGGHALEDRRGVVGVEAGEHVGLLVALHGVEDRRRLLDRQRLDEVRGVLVGDLFDQVRGLVGREGGQDQLAFLRPEADQRAEGLGGPDRVEVGLEPADVALAGKPDKPLPGVHLFLCFHGHVPPRPKPSDSYARRDRDSAIHAGVRSSVPAMAPTIAW